MRLPAFLITKSDRYIVGIRKVLGFMNHKRMWCVEIEETVAILYLSARRQRKALSIKVVDLSFIIFPCDMALGSGSTVWIFVA